MSPTCKITRFLLFIFLNVIAFVTSIGGADPLECRNKSKQPKPPTELLLDCSRYDDTVTTGFIIGGNIPDAHGKQRSKPKRSLLESVIGRPNMPKQPKDASKCSPGAGDCQAPPGTGRVLEEIKQCLWKNNICKIPVMGQLAGKCKFKPVSYLTAKRFRCVKKSRIHRLCEQEKPVIISESENEFYILSKGYPEVNNANTNCSLDIISNTGGMYLTSHHMHIHPKIEGSCSYEFLELQNADDSSSLKRFCGHETVNFNGTSKVHVRFVPLSKPKLYTGFVIHGSTMPPTDAVNTARPSHQSLPSPGTEKHARINGEHARRHRHKNKKKY